MQEISNHGTMKMIGGQYPLGGRRCLTLKELEESVPSNVLLECYSCLTLQKPSIREIVKKYGKTVWGQPTTKNSFGESKDVTNTSKSIPKSENSSRSEKISKVSKNVKITKTISGDKVIPPKRPQKRRNNLPNSRSANSTRKKIDITVELEPAVHAVESINKVATGCSITFSTVQMLRSLAVCLKTIAAKKAALLWAEHQLAEETDGAASNQSHRLLRQWKQHFQKLELKDKVASRKQERKKLSKQAKRDKRRLRKKEMQKYFSLGQQNEMLLLKNFDMKTRSVYEPPSGGNIGGNKIRGKRCYRVFNDYDGEQKGENDSEEDEELRYADDFEVEMEMEGEVEEAEAEEKEEGKEEEQEEEKEEGKEEEQEEEEEEYLYSSESSNGDDQESQEWSFVTSGA